VGTKGEGDMGRINHPDFLLLDGRAKSGLDDDIDRAVIMDTAKTEGEARLRGETLWKGFDAIWLDSTKDEYGELRYDLPPQGQGE